MVRARIMVHPQEDRNNALEQFREAPRQDTATPAYPGEIIGGHREPPFEVVGLDALSPLFATIQFPATKDEVIAAIGEARIPIARTKLASGREIVERTAPNEFRSSMDLEMAIRGIMGTFTPPGERGSRRG